MLNSILYFVITLMLENVYDEIYDYAAFKQYPKTSSKNERRIIRRKCVEHYYVTDGLLHYSAVGTSKALKISTLLDRKWKTVVRTCEEGKRIMESCHSSPHSEYINYDHLNNYTYVIASYSLFYF